MSAFEFVFSLFGLLLGFSLVEVLGGFARTINARPKIRLGWLTPLLAIFVMLDVTGFWSIAWQARDVIPPTYGALVVGLAITGLYYFAASVIFPNAQGGGNDLDQHFFESKAKVLAAVLLCQLLAHAARYAVMGPSAFAHWSFADWAITPVFLGGLIAGIFVRGRTANLIVLVVLIGMYVLDAVRSLSS